MEYIDWRFQAKANSKLALVLKLLKSDAQLGQKPKAQVEWILCAFLLPIALRGQEAEAQADSYDQQQVFLAMESIRILEMQAMKIRNLYGIDYSSFPIPGAGEIAAVNPLKRKPTALRALQINRPTFAHEPTQEDLAPYFNQFD